MNTIVDFVTKKLIEEVAEEYKKLGHLSDTLLSVLNCFFGQPLLSALDLVDHRVIQRIYTSSGQEVYKVCSNSSREYICSASLQFCPCLSFSFGVVKRQELVMCKHILAIHLSKACHLCVDVELSPEEFSALYETAN